MALLQGMSTNHSTIEFPSKLGYLYLVSCPWGNAPGAFVWQLHPLSALEEWKGNRGEAWVGPTGASVICPSLMPLHLTAQELPLSLSAGVQHHRALYHNLSLNDFVCFWADMFGVHMIPQGTYIMVNSHPSIRLASLLHQRSDRMAYMPKLCR